MNVHEGTITSWSEDTVVSAWSAKGEPLGDISIQWQEASEGYVGRLHFQSTHPREKESYKDFNINFLYDGNEIKKTWWLTGVNFLEDKEVIAGESIHTFFAENLEEL